KKKNYNLIFYLCVFAASFLHNVSFRDLKVACFTPRQLAHATEVFEVVACLMYDCLDWRRQHRLYLSNMKIIHIPHLTTDRVAEKPTICPMASTKQNTPSGPDVNMCYYNDLLSDLPEELITVPVILQCMLDQVVAAESALVPPSEAEPRADGLDPDIAGHLLSMFDSLALLEKEKKSLDNVFLSQSKEDPEEPAEVPAGGPHLLNHHDKMGQIACRSKVNSLDPVMIEEEMLQKLPLAELLHFTQPSLEQDSRRLAQIHELMYHCTDDSLAWEDVGRAFKLFTLENLQLSGVDDLGQLEGSGKSLGGDCVIPWDNPARFAQEMLKLASVKKMYRQAAMCHMTNSFNPPDLDHYLCASTTIKSTVSNTSPFQTLTQHQPQHLTLSSIHPTSTPHLIKH
uniref:Uncharacterized protein n=1 Tax=Leptobrachium leishanense TaxID=445787 RepID=A0A8C5MMZ7_9ANUR